MTVKYANWKVVGLNKDGKEEDITSQLSYFIQNQIEEEVQTIEEEEKHD
jgi:hypothetical protein